MTTKRRPTIGADPLDALLSAPRPTTRPAPAKSSTPSRKAPKAKKEAEPQAAPSRLLKATYNVPADLVEETRNAVVALSGPPVRLTLSGLVETALRRELERLRKAHNGGEPFSGPGTALRGGRPLK